MTPEDVPAIDFLPAPVAEEAPQSLFALSYQGEWWWVPTGPVNVLEPISDVAIQTDRPDVYAMVTRSGAIWVSPDSGISWREGLRGNREVVNNTAIEDPQQLLRDVVSDIDVESVGNNSYNAESGDLDDAVGQIQQALEQLEEANQGTKSAVLPERLDVRPRVWFDGEVLFCARQDGLHRSPDLGRTWDRVITGPVTSYIVTPLGRFAGTTSGLRVSEDGRTWRDPDDGTEDLQILALEATQSGLHAGTADGLWTSPDGTFWFRRHAFDEPVLSVVGDPDIEGRLWVSLPRAVLSSDDNGQSFEEPLTAPLPGVTEMLHVGPLHWVASSADGPWETMNGGLSWVPIARGLGSPDTPGIEAVAGRLLLASSEGVYRMERAPELLRDPDAEAAIFKDDLSGWISRGALVDSALGRVGLRHRRSASRLVQSLLPQLTTGGWYTVSDGVAYNSGLGQEFLLDGDAGTIRPFDRFWRFHVELRWAPPGRKTSGDFSGSDADVAEVDYGVEIGLFNNGQDYGGDRRTALYKTQIARRVNELYTTRAEALQRRPSTARAPLLQQVQLELFIAELEAELDALTNGAVSSWNSP